MKVELDRFEGEFGVLLFQGTEVVVPRSWLPSDANEGDAFIVSLEQDGDSHTSHRVDSALSRLTEEDVSGSGLEL
jgi:hypothetical protein